LWSHQSQDHPRPDNPRPDKPSEAGISGGKLSKGEEAGGATSDATGDDTTGDGEFDEMTETVPLAHVSNHFGGGYTLFVCPGLQGDDTSSDDTSSVAAIDTSSGDTSSVAATDTSSANNDAASDAANNDAAVHAVAASCGKRTVRLYLARLSGLPGRFLCRQCSQLVYATSYELPWQRARRRVNKLRRRLGVEPGVSTMVVAPPKPRFITVDRYEYLLDKLLEAEIAVTEAQTEYFLELVERIERRNRRNPQFTL
jgi:hypothetical protein